MWCALAVAVVPGNHVCDSRRVDGVALRSIPGGNGPTLDVATADACEVGAQELSGSCMH